MKVLSLIWDPHFDFHNIYSTYNIGSLHCCNLFQDIHTFYAEASKGPVLTIIYLSKYHIYYYHTYKSGSLNMSIEFRSCCNTPFMWMQNQPFQNQNHVANALYDFDDVKVPKIVILFVQMILFFVIIRIFFLPYWYILHGKSRYFIWSN